MTLRIALATVATFLAGSAQADLMPPPRATGVLVVECKSVDTFVVTVTPQYLSNARVIVAVGSAEPQLNGYFNGHFAFDGSFSDSFRAFASWTDAGKRFHSASLQFAFSPYVALGTAKGVFTSRRPNGREVKLDVACRASR